ncbi:hypothetical protein ACP3VS_13260 [Lysinibacillus sp. VIII_CA]|uniref:hypothetical protein n=1 Tax=Lysinibacillus sp. VIII_CA TaxID=3417452 RepID=UPI003CFA97C4
MALKKVRRPVLQGEKKFNEMKEKERVSALEQESEAQELQLENIEESQEELPYDTNNLDTNHFNLIEDESPLERLITFLDGKVRLPRKAKVGKGECLFQINSVATKEGIQGKFGYYDQYLFTFSLTQSSGEVPVQITVPFTISSNPESPLMKFLMSFRSIFEGQRITVQQLVGLRGTCEIDHYITEAGDEYERLVVKSIENHTN